MTGLSGRPGRVPDHPAPLAGLVVVHFFAGLAVLIALLYMMIAMAPSDPCAPSPVECGPAPLPRFGAGAFALVVCTLAAVVFWVPRGRYLTRIAVLGAAALASLAVEAWTAAG
jgi:hypothetical protein